MRPEIQSWRQSESHSAITRNGDPGAHWFDGEVYTPRGIVVVYSQGLEDRDSTSSAYRTVYRGRYYYASERKARTLHGLAIMAGKFMREVVAGGPAVPDGGEETTKEPNT